MVCALCTGGEAGIESVAGVRPVIELAGLTSATARSLAAYGGTVAPHHGLDVGERPCSGEGLCGVRWVACVRALPPPSLPPCKG